MTKLVPRIIILLLPLFVLQGCNDNRDKFTETYISALSRGDLLEATVDTDKLTYSYKVLDGDYKGTALGEGRGTLKPYPDVSRNAYQTKINDQVTTVVALQGEVIIGHIGNEFYVGVPERKQPINVADIAGLYNYVSYSPNGTLDEGLGFKIPWEKTSFGILRLNDDNTWAVLHKGDLKTSSKKPTLEGSFTDMGNGALLLERNGGKFAHVMVRYDNSGDHFAVVDLVDPDFKGIAFANFQSPVSSDNIQGPYTALLTHETKAPKCLAQDGYMSVNGDATKYSMKFNTPWPGFVRADAPALGGNRYEVFGIISRQSGSIYGIHLERQPHGAAANQQGFIALKD
ncbi:MAG TPA: hypothetical protein VEL47_01970 [Myxococcota bacterium]|nr:hypothetical protein [Myxococcota bacterium]